MALPLSKQTRNEVEALSASVADFADDVGQWRDFAAQNAAAIVAWPRNANGTLFGYAQGPTLAELGKINSLVDALAALGQQHAEALAVLRRCR